MSLPWGLCAAPNGDLYVADWGNDRVQRFTPDGEFVAAYGSPGSGEGQLRRPSSVAVDERGFMYISDWGNERVQVFDADGRFIQQLRGQATESKWAVNFLSINRGGRRRSRQGQPGTGHSYPRPRRSARSLLAHREVLLVAGVGQAGPGRQAIRDGEQPT